MSSRQNFLYFSGAGIATSLLFMPSSRSMESKTTGILVAIAALWYYSD